MAFIIRADEFSLSLNFAHRGGGGGGVREKQYCANFNTSKVVPSGNIFVGFP